MSNYLGGSNWGFFYDVDGITEGEVIEPFETAELKHFAIMSTKHGYQIIFCPPGGLPLHVVRNLYDKSKHNYGGDYIWGSLLWLRVGPKFNEYGHVKSLAPYRIAGKLDLGMFKTRKWYQVWD